MSTYLRLGIESEIFLVPRDSGQDFTSLEGFANFMAKTYNQKKRAALPKMHVNIDGSYSGHNQAIEWTLTNDTSLKPDNGDKQCNRFSLFSVGPYVFRSDESSCLKCSRSRTCLTDFPIHLHLRLAQSRNGSLGHLLLALHNPNQRNLWDTCPHLAKHRVRTLLSQIHRTGDTLLRVCH